MKKKKICITKLEATLYKSAKNDESFVVHLTIAEYRGCPFKLVIEEDICSKQVNVQYRDYDFETFLYVERDAFVSLCNKLQVHDAQSLRLKMLERFQQFGEDALAQICQFLENNSIAYSKKTY